MRGSGLDQGTGREKEARRMEEMEEMRNGSVKFQQQ